MAQTRGLSVMISMIGAWAAGLGCGGPENEGETGLEVGNTNDTSSSGDGDGDPGDGDGEGDGDGDPGDGDGDPQPCAGDGSWTTVGMLGMGLQWPFGATLDDGSVVIAGGMGEGGGADRRTETYVFDGSQLAPVGPLAVGRYHAELAWTANGLVV